jgi:diguanylate cyclase (GGDEF)-like protein
MVLVSVIIGYFVAGRIGLGLSDEYAAASLIWPGAGVAVGAFVVLGYRIWPAIFGSAVALYASVVGPDPAVLGMAAGNTAEGLLSAYLINRYAGGRHALQDPRNCLRFAGVVLLACLTTAATFNAFSMVIGGLAPGIAYGELWLVQCLGSAGGIFLVAPLIIQHTQGTRERWPRRKLTEACALSLLLLVSGLVVFFEFPVTLRGFTNELICLPLLMWAALRLGRRMAVGALLLLAVLAIGGTLNEAGPFWRGTPLTSLIVVQIFLVPSAVMTLLMAALASEYSIAEAQLRELVVTDPLTGLPNYRRLLEVLSAEIAQANRTDRTFAVVFFDMDGLKRINDRMGHLVGSRAVCRFADTLQSACRATDTPARYGGDEFVAVLSDTDHEGAKLVVRRTADRLAEDRDEPRLSVSAGIAVYPRDGGTPTTLLSAADRALYAVKAQKATSQRRVVRLREWPNAS